MSTESTSATEDALRTRLLTFPALTDGATLAEVLGRTELGNGSDGKLFWDAAPDNVTKNGDARWGLIRLQNRRSEGDGQERERAELEVMLFARPRNQKATLERCADLCDQAMLRYVDASRGMVACWSRMRSTLPPAVAPVDSEMVQIRLVYMLVLYPSYLTQYHDQ